MVDRTLRQAAAHGETRMPGADDHRVHGVNCGLSFGRVCRMKRLSIHHDRDIGWIGDDVVDRRPLLRLRHQCLDIFALGVGVDIVLHRDAAKAIADVAVDAEYARRGPCRLPGSP